MMRSDGDDLVLEAFSDGRSVKMAGWTKIRVTRGIERMPSDFSVTTTAPKPTPKGAPVLEEALKAGMRCTLSVVDKSIDSPSADKTLKRVVSGYIDRVVHQISDGEHQISVTGRGYCQDIADCAADWQGMQFLTKNALQIAQDLCRPYGVNVTCSDPGEVFPQINLTPGQTVFSVIHELCRARGLLAYEDENGDLVLAPPRSFEGQGWGGERDKTLRIPAGLEIGVNVEQASYQASMDQRFSDYRVVQQGPADIGAALMDIYDVSDPGVPRYRLKYLSPLAGDPQFTFSKLAATWEARRRYGRSHVIQVVVSGWRNDLTGDLWAPNTLCSMELGKIGVKPKVGLIAEVSFSRDDTGTRASLTIMPPAAFSVQPFNPYAAGSRDVFNALGKTK